MAYYTALINSWNSATQPPTGVTGTGLTAQMTTAQKLAAVNGWTVPGPNVDVPVSAVVGYLGLNVKLTTLTKYAASAPATAAGVAGAELVAIINCPNAPAFAASNPAVYATLQGMLTVLAGDSSSGVTTTDVTNLLALAGTRSPWWQASVASGGAGLSSAISENDLIAAGGLT